MTNVAAVRARRTAPKLATRVETTDPALLRRVGGAVGANGIRRATPLILAVDDEMPNLYLLEAQLEPQGYDVRLAHGGRAGLAVAQEELPDLILLDVLMPQLDGYQILRQLKEARQTRTIPVLLVTSLYDRSDKIRGLVAGADDFLSRPIDPAELLARVRSLLRIKALYDEAQALNQELERRLADRAALDLSEARLSMLVDRIQDYAIAMIDADGRIVTWNPAAQRILGYSPEEIVGRGYSQLFSGEDRASGLPARLLQDAAQSGRVEAEGWRVGRDGFRFWADAVLTVLRDPDGALLGYCEVTRDYTARRAAEQERAGILAREQAARAQAEAAVQARDEFLSIASHELRTPVTAIAASAQLLVRALQRGRPDSAGLQQSLEQIHGSSRRLAVLIEDLLDVSRLQNGCLPLRPSETDLSQLVIRAVEDCRARLPSTHTIELRIDLSSCSVICDRARIEQVLTNLLDNAIKYSPNGGLISVVVAADDGGYLLRVQDRGIGLPPDASDTIFQPFGRASNARTRQLQGMGLGLYLCRQIVDAHCGRIWAESPGEDNGTTVTLRLPMHSSLTLAADY